MTNRDPKYYYIKPKAVPAVVYRKAVTVAEKPEDPIVSPETPAAKATVMDMSFGGSRLGASAIIEHRPIIGAGVWTLRLMAMGLIVATLYVGGGMVAAQASAIKADISQLATRGVLKLEAAATALNAKDFATANNQFIAAENIFTQAQQEMLHLGQANLYMADINSGISQVTTGLKLVDAGLHLAQGGKAMVVALQPVNSYLNSRQTVGGTAEDLPAQLAQLLSDAKPQLTTAIGKVERADYLLSSVDLSRAEPQYAAAIREAQIKTASLNHAVSVLGALAQELPNALGFGNPRKYLILNQNSNELRATGGFIGSFAVVEVYKGKIQDIFVDITQRIDGQNPNSSLPLPAPLRAVAATGGFGTRDANWYLDFPTSVATFQKLYEEGGGGTADGAIAINPAVIEDLLGIIGPIYLSTKDVTITADNFVTVTQEHTQVIDHNKTNPKEILSNLAPILLDRVLKADATQTEAINSMLLTRLAQKDILLTARNSRLSGALTELGFSGRLTDLPAGSDFLSIVHSNLGGRKSSSSVARRAEHTTTVTLDGEVYSTLKLGYTHQGTHDWPDGINKDYVRLYLPSGTTLVKSIGLDDGTVADVYDAEGRTVIGFWVTTDPQTSHDVEINYKLPFAITDHYDLTVVKQPGADLRLTSVLKVSNVFSLSDTENVQSKTLVSGKLETDQRFSLGVIHN